MSASNVNTVANDFVIPAGKTLKIDKIIPHLIRFSYGATVAFYKDNNGKPGDLIINYTTPTIEAQNVIGSTVGGTVYETIIKLPQTLELTSGKYWVAINMQGSLIYWETKFPYQTELRHLQPEMEQIGRLKKVLMVYS